LSCKFYYESNLGYATSQIVYFQKKNLLIVALSEGAVLFWDLKKLLARGEIPGKKMIKMFHNIHFKYKFQYF
jgi:hypothetical protein